MRAARTLLFVLGGVLVLALATAWFLPGQLDWTRYRGTIEAIAGTTLGRPVRIDGRVAFALLPEPVITADGVDIADGRGGATLRVRALRLRVALVPLLRGRIEPRELVLREPLLTLPWPLPESLALSVPDWFGTFSARIEGGRLRLGALEFGGIDATLTDMASGAMSMSGTARVTGLDWHFSARLRPADGDGAQGLDVALEGKEQASGLGGTFAGQIEPDGSVDGRLAGRGPDLSLLMPAPHVPFHGEGRLAATSGLLALEDMDLTLDGTQVQGAASMRMHPAQRIDVALAAGQLDLEPWLPVLRAAAPAPVPVGLDLSVEAAGFAGGVLRRLRVAIDEDRTGFQIRNASARLPGEAVVHLKGHLAAEGRTRPHFSGEFGLDAPDFPTSLGWFDKALGWGPADLPPDVLRAVSLQGKAEAAPGAVELRSLSGQIDGAPFTGRFGLNTGARPVIAADLAFQTLPLDPWLRARPPTLEALPGVFGGELKVRAERALADGLDLQHFALDAASRDGTLTLRGLDATLDGARIQAAGIVGEGGRISNGRLSLAAPEASPIAALLPDAWRGTPALWRGPLAVQVTAAGAPKSLALSIGVDLHDGRLEASPVLDLASRSWRGPLTVRHPSALRLLADTGLITDVGWLGHGSLSLSGQFAGTPGHVAADDFTLVAGGLRARGRIAVDSSGPVPAVSGGLDAETLPLPVYSPTEAAPLPLDRLAGWRLALTLQAAAATAEGETVARDARGTLVLQDGRLRIAELAARVRDGEVNGALDLDTTAEPPKLDGRVALRDLALTGTPLQGRFGGTVRLHAEGHSPAALTATAAGPIALSMPQGVLSGIDLGALRASATGAPLSDLTQAKAAFGAALGTGATRFDSLSLDGTIEHGVLRIGAGKLAAPEGMIDLSGTIALPSLGLDLRAAVRPALPDAPDIGVRLGGTAYAPQRAVELGGLARWLLDRPAQ